MGLGATTSCYCFIIMLVAIVVKLCTSYVMGVSMYLVTIAWLLYVFVYLYPINISNGISGLKLNVALK